MVVYIHRQVVLGPARVCKTESSILYGPCYVLNNSPVRSDTAWNSKKTFFQILVLIFSHDFPLDEIYPERCKIDILLLPVAASG